MARPRYLRIGAAAGSLAVTLVALLGGVGILPTGTDTAEASVSHAAPLRQLEPLDGDRASIALSGTTPPSSASGEGGTEAAGEESGATLPSRSGVGRRVVFDMTRQRVWLVGQHADEDVVRRTYLVSGSVTDNLKPGTYSVYSRSPLAWGVDDSGTMRYMVRFTRGERAAIGFHDIPELDGKKVQSRAQLGTAQSHGCIRQWRPDARALWDFAPIGTKVVVVA